MIIRQSTISDIPELIKIYDHARTFMKTTGNPNQWINGYPSLEVIKNDIEAGHSYICQTKEWGIIATFCFIIGEDPTYSVIENGHWLNDLPYGTIHRLASLGVVNGITEKCFDFCFSKIPNLRADTHKDNIIMQKLLLKNGFIECGIIYVANGSPRIAFQKSVNMII